MSLSLGDVLNIDPLTFYSQLYRMLPRLHAGQRSPSHFTCSSFPCQPPAHCSLSASGGPNDDIIIVLRCLDAMLTRRRKQVSLQRAMAFVKRLGVLSLHVLPNASVGLLAAGRATVHVSERRCSLYKQCL